MRKSIIEQIYKIFQNKDRFSKEYQVRQESPAIIIYQVINQYKTSFHTQRQLPSDQTQAPSHLNIPTYNSDCFIQMQQKSQQPFQINLSCCRIELRIPSLLKKSFSITNLTLRPLVIYPIVSHEDQVYMTLNNKIKILQAFQQVQITIGLKSMGFNFSQIIKPRLRIYFWQIKQFTQQQQALLELDEQLLKSPRKALRAQNGTHLEQISHFNDNEAQQSQTSRPALISSSQLKQHFQTGRRRDKILLKYKQKMFNIKNISQQSYNSLRQKQRPFENCKTKTKTNNSHKQQEQTRIIYQSESDEQESFSRLMHRDYQISVSIDSSLYASGRSAARPSQISTLSSRFHFLLQNLIKPALSQLNQSQKKLQVEFIQNRVFNQCQKLGKVKGIDRLGQEVHLEPNASHSINNTRNVNNRNTPTRNNQKQLSVQISQSALKLDRYLVQYKFQQRKQDRIIKQQSVKITDQPEIETNQPGVVKVLPRMVKNQVGTVKNQVGTVKSQVGTVKSQVETKGNFDSEFIEIISQRHYYLYRLRKVVGLEYYGKKSFKQQNSNPMPKQKNSCTRINDKNSTVSQGTSALPMLIDLSKIRNIDYYKEVKSKRQLAKQRITKQRKDEYQRLQLDKERELLVRARLSGDHTKQQTFKSEQNKQDIEIRAKQKNEFGDSSNWPSEADFTLTIEKDAQNTTAEDHYYKQPQIKTYDPITTNINQQKGPIKSTFIQTNCPNDNQELQPLQHQNYVEQQQGYDQQTTQQPPNQQKQQEETQNKVIHNKSKHKQAVFNRQQDQLINVKFDLPQLCHPQSTPQHITHQTSLAASTIQHITDKKSLSVAAQTKVQQTPNSTNQHIIRIQTRESIPVYNLQSAATNQFPQQIQPIHQQIQPSFQQKQPIPQQKQPSPQQKQLSCSPSEVGFNNLSILISSPLTDKYQGFSQQENKVFPLDQPALLIQQKQKGLILNGEDANQEQIKWNEFYQQKITDEQKEIGEEKQTNQEKKIFFDTQLGKGSMESLECRESRASDYVYIGQGNSINTQVPQQHVNFGTGAHSKDLEQIANNQANEQKQKASAYKHSLFNNPIVNQDIHTEQNHTTAQMQVQGQSKAVVQLEVAFENYTRLETCQQMNFHSSLIQSNRLAHNFVQEYSNQQSLYSLSQQYQVHQQKQYNTFQQCQKPEQTRQKREESIVKISKSIKNQDEQLFIDQELSQQQQNDHVQSLTQVMPQTRQSIPCLTKKKNSLSQSFSHPLNPRHQLTLHHEQDKPKYQCQMISYPDSVLQMLIMSSSLQSNSQQPQTQHKKSGIFQHNNESKYQQKGPAIVLLFRTHIHCFPIHNSSLQRIIKIDPMKQADILNSPVKITSYKDQEIIHANGSYLYWTNLRGQQSEWKYVQRKQIFAVQVIQQMGLLAVGGKNFSKLSFFGKETSRSNIKIYNCGKSQRNHLFTYDIPIDENVGSVLQLKYITTPPSGSKLLIAYTNYNDQIHKLLFFRIRAFNNIEVYGKFDLNQIGIQSIISIKYNPKSMKLLVLQQVSEDHSALKRLKVKSMYEKAEVLTQCIKMELGSYESFEMGGQKQTQWYFMISKGKHMASIYRTNRFHNNPETVEQQNYDIQAVFYVNDGNQIIVRGYDFIQIRKRKKAVQESYH